MLQVQKNTQVYEYKYARHTVNYAIQVHSKILKTPGVQLRNERLLVLNTPFIRRRWLDERLAELSTSQLTGAS